MADRRSSIGVAQLIWVVVAGLSAVLFVVAVVNLSIWLATRTDHDVAVTLALPTGVLLGLVLWIQILGVVWRWRRSSLQRSAVRIAASIVDSSYRRLNRTNGFGQHRVQIEAQYTHPETGTEHRLRQEYMFSAFERHRAREFHERFPRGSHLPMLMVGRHARFDLRERPTWTDIW
ncbi:hypothetical protein ACFWU5_06365 [Nocardia sp. NPDC058640]|uniref:hypothetical protein n=1 Tax=Nocardia sp. NPDC058640 TaxID=3346571 RepID=UPI00364A1AF3